MSLAAGGREGTVMKGKDMKKELGSAGNQIISGQIIDDPNPNFHTFEAAKYYDEMRRSDAMVRATIEMVRRPIMAASWRVPPVDQDDSLEVEIANFVTEALENRMARPFSQLLSEILLFPFFGFYYFEKVFKIEDGKIWWDKWASRIPTAHYRWEIQAEDGSIQPGVTQQLPYSPYKDGKWGDTQPKIPMDKLILFVYQQEGDNYDGYPILRTAWRSYYTKDILYKIQAIRAERGSGILVVGLPDSHGDTDQADAEEMCRNFKSVEQTFIIKPNKEWEIELMTAGISDKTSDIADSIKHHNEMIAMNILGQFVLLGSGGAGGSYALSRDQSDFFTLGLAEITRQAAAVINKQAIEELVTLNYGKREKYPKLVFDQIGQIDYAEMSNALSTLASAGLVDVDDNMKIWVRKSFGLPELTPEELEAQAEKDEVDEPVEEEAPIEEEGQATDDLMDGLDDLDSELSEKSKKKIPGASGSLSNKAAFKSRIATLSMQIKRLKASGQLSEVQKQRFQKTIASMRTQLSVKKPAKVPKANLCETHTKLAAFKPFRELTLAEQRVKFADVSSFFKTHQEKVRGILNEFVAAQKPALMSKLTTALENSDVATVRDLAFTNVASLKSSLKLEAKNALEFGKSQAAGEINKETPSTPAVLTQTMNAQIDQMVDDYTSTVISDVKTTALTNLTTGVGVTAAIYGLSQVFDDSVAGQDSYVTSTLTGTALNIGREIVFDYNAEDLHALQRSEILDDVTCNICMSIDGATLDEKNPFTSLTQVHSNCRGIWVAVLNDDSELPTVKDLPKSIKSKFETTEGVPTVNNFVQLKKPIVGSGSRLQQKIDDGNM